MNTPQMGRGREVIKDQGLSPDWRSEQTVAPPSKGVNPVELGFPIHIEVIKPGNMELLNLAESFG